MRSIRERILRAIFRISRYYAWWVLILALILTGAAAYYMRELPVRSSYFDLLPRDNPLIDAYRHSEEYLAQSDYIALLLSLVEVDGKSEKEREHLLLTAAQTITDLLCQDPEFLDVTYLVEPSPEIPDQYLLLYRLDKEKLARIESSVALARHSIANGELSLLPTTDLSDAYRQVGEAFERILSRGGIDLSETVNLSTVGGDLAGMIALNEAVLGAIDGIDAFPTVREAVQNLAEIFTANEQEVPRAPEGFFSHDRTKLLMSVRPRFASQRGVKYCAQVMEALRVNLSQVDLDRLGVTVGVTGTYPFAATTNAVINADMQRTTIISSVGIFLIFFLAFGSILYSIVAVIPLLITLVLTIAWAKFAMGGFNLITTFLPALILGLGIDYGIHLIARYAEERSKGSSFNRALYTAVLYKGEASFVAAMTTALVFLCLLSSRSRALFEMGAISSMGVILAFLTTIFLLPSLLTLIHFIFRFHHKEGVLNYAPHLSPFFRFVAGKGRAIFVIVLILTFFVTFQAARTSFQFSSNDLVPRVESQEILNEILVNFGATGAQIARYFTFFASSEEELTSVVEHLTQSDLVEGVESARDLLPVNLSEQQQVLNSLNIDSYIDQLTLLDRSLANRASTLVQIRNLLTQFALVQYGATLSGRVEITLASSEIQKQLREIQNELKSLDVEQAHAKIAALQEALLNLETNLLQIRDLPPIETLLHDILKGLPEGIRNRYITADEKYVVRARMSEAIFDGNARQQFNSYAASFSDDYFGMPLVVGELERIIKRDFLVATLLAAVLITLVLWRSLGGWARALVAGTPLILGYVWMLGGMRLLQIDFNFINITISPLLIGIGVDSGIHILHRYVEERELDPEGAIERGGQMTALAVIVTSLTTMLVFASLLLARTPGLRLLGISALLGIGFTLIFSLLFLPAALRIAGKRV